MSITRIQNNQITDSTIVAYAKLQSGSLTGNLFASSLTLNSNVTINGNLFLANTGNAATINATNTYINDPIVTFNNGYGGSLSGYDIGMLINRNLTPLAPYGSVNTAWVWVENDQAFEAIATTSTATNATSLTSSGFANVKVGNLVSVSETTGTLVVTGPTTLNTATVGGLQAVAIGNATPGTAVFTTANITATTATTGIGSGALQVAGGTYIAGNLWVAGNINFTPNAVSTITGNSAQFFGNASGFGAVYAGINSGYVYQPQTVIQNSTNFNGYAQLNHQNISSGSNASTDYVATADNGTAVDTYIDFGINSSGFTPTATQGPNDGYLYIHGNTNTGGGNLLLASVHNDIIFATNGTDISNVYEYGRIKANGNAFVVKSTTAATNTTSGALQIAGGVGIQGSLYAGSIQATPIGSTTPSTAVFTTVNTTGNIVANSGVGSLTIYGNAISSNTGKIGLGSISNVQITGGSSGYTIVTDGAGNLSFASLLGNSIQLGANTAGQLVSNAVSLTSSTDITDAVAQLNAILGKLVPSAPSSFPTSTLTTSTGEYSGYMTSGWSQVDNSGWGNLAVSAGTLVSTSTRVSTFGLNTISNNGTTASGGNIQLFVNGSIPSNSYHNFSSTASSADNGSYGQITISAAEDYHVVSSSVPAGFWYIFSVSSSLTGISSGWNRTNLYYTGDGASTNTITWYYDASAPSSPAFSATSMVLSSNTVTYSSTIPHLNSSAGFTLSGTVQNLSGDLYYSAWSSTSANFFSSTGSGGALLAPANRTLAQVGVPLPLTRNNASPYSFSTTSNVTTGFGSAASTLGPAVSVSTPYATTSSGAFAPGNIILYKTGTTTQIEETAMTNTLSGAPSTFRIVNPDGGTAADTPAYTGSESAFNSSSSTLLSTDATVVAAKLQYDITNYSSGYYPVGPNLSSGRSSSQYYTFKFSLAALSTFHINYTGTLAGLWMACPGVTDTPASPTNGWLNCASAYGGAGVPGTGTGGNGTNGCAVGGNATLNSNGSYSVQVTLGSVNTSSAGNKSNEIYVRVKLTSGQSLTALSIAT